MEEQVNHPQHYNQHPAGIECIDIIRHYTCDIANAIKYLWRAGLKKDYSQSDCDKEIEDLKKAMWYIMDYKKNCVRFSLLLDKEEVDTVVYEVTGHHGEQIFNCYPKSICIALSQLLGVGIIFQGEVRHVVDWRDNLTIAYNSIQERVGNLESRVVSLDFKNA